MAYIGLKCNVILLILNYINQNETVLYDEIKFKIAIKLISINNKKILTSYSIVV